MLEYLSKSFKTTLIHLHYVLHISLLETLVLETADLETGNFGLLSFQIKILEFWCQNP